VHQLLTGLTTPQDRSDSRIEHHHFHVATVQSSPSTHPLPMNQTLNSSRLMSAAALLMALTATGCGHLSHRDQNTAVGAGIGGVAGAVLTGGSTLGTVGGAMVGGVIGNQVTTKK
jgi:osmotically inducible lipoprotein OsmB